MPVDDEVYYIKRRRHNLIIGSIIWDIVYYVKDIIIYDFGIPLPIIIKSQVSSKRPINAPIHGRNY